MAKRYIVDLRTLDTAERAAAYELIDGLSFMASRIMGETGLEGADIIWSSTEDFPTSPAFPHGCSYREIS